MTKKTTNNNKDEQYRMGYIVASLDHLKKDINQRFQHVDKRFDFQQRTIWGLYVFMIGISYRLFLL